MKEQLQDIMSAEMTRKEFLQHIGAATLVFLGVAGMLSALKPKQSGKGYGLSAYGGIKR